MSTVHVVQCRVQCMSAVQSTVREYSAAYNLFIAP
jgi:hypothetical protein